MRPLIVLAAAALALTCGPASAFRVATWNLLNFNFTSDPSPGSHGELRVQGMRDAIASIHPDIIVCQEMISASAATYFLTGVLDEAFPGEYLASSFYNGPDTDNMCYYRADVTDLVGQDYHYQAGTTVRYICEYTLRLDGTAAEITVYSMHLKAGSGYESERAAEARYLRRSVLNDLPSGTQFIVTGDFNVYGPSEDAYTEFLDSQPPPSGEDNDGRCFDPLGGAWSAWTHTQSTRTADLGDGGSTGGLDDRFDLLLLSDALDDDADIEYSTDSYVSYGNDGLHYNKAIIDYPYYDPPGPADAYDLYYASDHLPVYADFVWLGGPDTYPPTPNPMEWQTSPAADGPNSISMTCQTGSDATPPVEYYFEETSGSAGGDDRGWDTDVSYTDSSLSPNNYYAYRVQARDSAAPPNAGDWSSEVGLYTHAATPGAPTLGSPTQFTIDLTPDDGGNPAGTELAIWNVTLADYVAADGSPSGTAVWQTAAGWGTVTVTSLSPGVTYEFRVKARNAEAVETALGPAAGLTTLTHVYVDASATGAGDGSSWDDAFNTIQAGLSAANEVWVAAGTYNEDISPLYDDELYGGFDGTETAREQRNPAANVTTINGTGTDAVVSCDNVTGVTIDGFTITGGAGGSGGGIHWYGSSGTIAHNVITGNNSAVGGGGIYCEDGAGTSIIGNVITGNGAAAGGGIYVRESQPLIERNRIEDNTATDFGGGICYYRLGGGTAAGNVIAGNAAEGVFCYLSSPQLTCNTVTDNTLSGALLESSSAGLSNNIICSNWGGGIEKIGTGSPTISHNNVWDNALGDYIGTSAGGGDISADPLFADADYHIADWSPCADAGDNGAAGAPAEDLDGDGRPHDGDGDGQADLDIGADETTQVGSLSPSGWLHGGWNLISLPLAPTDADPEAALDQCVAAGNTLSNNLYQYGGPAGYSIYPGGFTTLASARGYWLNLTTGAEEDLSGEGPGPDAPIPLYDGWTMLGCPYPGPVAWTDCSLTDGGQTKTFDQAVTDGWIEPNVYYYEGGVYRLSKPTGGDDDSLRPWYGYWFLTKQAGLQLLVPAP